jgi:hypothetical protein
MPITDYDSFINALAGGEYIAYFKNSLTLQQVGQLASLWPVGGFPSSGVVPSTAPVVCTSTMEGALFFTRAKSTLKTYIAGMDLTGAALHQMYFFDRMTHVGGFPTSSTATMEFSLKVPSSVRPAATTDGANSYWFIETQVAMGSSAKTFNIVFKDGFNADTTTAFSVTLGTTTTTTNVGQLFAVSPPSSQSISEIVACNWTTAGALAAGRYNLVCAKLLTTKPNGAVVNVPASYDFVQVGMPETAYNSCIWIVARASNATINTQSGGVSMIYG